MSGYGRALVSGGGVKIVCEIRTVNHRFLDCVVASPDTMISYESVVKRWISARMKRGRVEVRITLETARTGGAGGPVINDRLARWYGGKLVRLARSLGMQPPGVDMLAQLPGVVSRSERVPGPGRMLPLLRAAVFRALDRALAMRRREGATLAGDLMRRLLILEREVTWLSIEWPRYQRRQREKTDARVRALLERLGEERKTGPLKDVLATLERGDVTEELTRLRSHIDQFRQALRQGTPAGRKLDFLTQEIQREVHTTGAKTTDAAIGRRIVEMKEEVERVREQVQNLE